MKKALMLSMVVALVVPFAATFAAEPDVNGAWYMGGPMNAGQPCRIEQAGGGLTFVNERGERAAGNVKNSSTVVATGWGNLQGVLAEGGTRINWSNGTWWTRFPLLQGEWKIGGRACRIEQKGRELTFVNERGERSPGRFADGGAVVATGWNNLRGTLADGNRRINWANNTVWSR